MAGVISQATSSIESTTTTGTASTTTTSGASAVRKEAPSSASIERSAASTRCQLSSVPRTAVRAGSQKNQPSTSARAVQISSGSSDKPMTLGCRQ
jgi:hypothetical protein